MKLIGEVLEQNPIGTYSERAKSYNYLVNAEKSFEKNVDYFRKGFEVCLSKDFLELLYNYLTELSIT